MQATQTAPQPATPQPSAITIVGADGNAQTIAIPKTQDAVDALVRQRKEFSDELNSVASRRQELVNQIRSAPDGPARTGLEEHVKVLDSRTIQLESQLANVGQQLAAAPADLVRWSEARTYGGGGNSDDWEEGILVGGGTVLAFFALLSAWRRFRRKRRPKTQTPALTDSDNRMERLERGMEAIAIEVERISEGQRFVTRVLTESRQPAEQAALRADQTV